MKKVQTSCVVCQGPIYVAVNIDRETAVCASCKWQGKAPKRESLGRCAKCRIKLADDLISQEPGLCPFCYDKAFKAKQDQEAKAKEAALVPVYATDDDMTFPDTAVFGGFHWLNVNVNPVG